MSFFNKLKTRLFKSSSKIDEGLDAIVSDGGAEEALDTGAADQAAAQAAEREAEARAAARQADRAAQEQAEAEKRQQAEQAAREQELAEKAEREAQVRAKAQQAAQTERDAQMQAEAEARRAAEAKADEQQRADKAGLKAALNAEAQAGAGQNHATNAARIAEKEAAEKAERALAAKARADEHAQTARLAQQRTQTLRDAQEAKSAKAEQAAQPAPLTPDQPPEQLPARAPVTAPMTTLQPSALDAPETAPTGEKTGLLGRLFGREQKTVVRRVLDDDMLEQLEELLIAADMGVDTALRVTANMAEGRLGRKLSVAEIKDLMSAEITRIMDPVARPMPLYAHKPQVVLVVGVNGSGKTTTIGKLASQFKAAGKSVVIAAGDTFRAAAVEQLQVWGDRAGVPVLTAPEGSDPASLAFDAMTRATADGADLLMIDTAGRLQNRADLMEELSKIVRVIRKKDPDAPHNTLLVLDATTGQNALNQVKVFQDLADVSGLVMTKLDGTAKGGVLVALADKFGLPIHAIGVGEQIDDLAPFDPQEFADALVGIDR